MYPETVSCSSVSCGVSSGVSGESQYIYIYMSPLMYVFGDCLVF